MASGLYKAYKAKALGAGLNLTSVDVKVILGDAADYTVDLATHDFLDDLAAAARVATSAALGSKTVSTPEGGVFDAANITLSSVSGDVSEFLALFNDTPATEATKDLLGYIDGWGSVTPNGGDITVQWDDGANRIFKL